MKKLGKKGELGTVFLAGIALMTINAVAWKQANVGTTNKHGNHVYSLQQDGQRIWCKIQGKDAKTCDEKSAIYR